MTIRSILACALLVFASNGTVGCISTRRDIRDEATLLNLRAEASEHYVSVTREYRTALMQRVKAEYDDFTAGRRANPPTIDYLIITGGGDNGAFGAGFLKGWKQVRKDDPLAMPEFDVVTGVSTGALIAPFAFIGSDDSLNRISALYRNPQKDWIKERWPLYFLPTNISFAEVPGLERELKAAVTLDMAKQIAAAGKGRLLSVNATNLDDASPQVFELVPECARAVETGDMRRLHNILLASAGIPGEFPYREIDGTMYVDGSVTANMIYGGRLGEQDSLAAIWQSSFPNTPIPRIRYWIILNNQLHAHPVTVRARWFDIITRSIETSVRHGTRTSIRHLYALAEISRLKRNADVEVRLISIPDDWTPPVEGVFIKESMNRLADLGEKMGADPASWRADPLPP